jgi:membrane protein implicated in regulation of membrane protease activity
MAALFWLVVALAFGIAEIVTLALYAIFVAVAALAAAVAAALGQAPAVQVLVFAVVGILGMVAARPPLMAYLRRRRAPALLSGAQSMVGQEALVIDTIKGAHEPGHVRVSGESWPAVSQDGDPVAEGSTIKIVAIRQSTLVVKPK